jgi:hypothetical protein
MGIVQRVLGDRVRGGSTVTEEGQAPEFKVEDAPPAPQTGHVVLSFTADGGVEVQMQNVKASGLWAASRLLQRIGDLLWDQQRAQEAQRRAEIMSVAQAMQQQHLAQQRRGRRA